MYHGNYVAVVIPAYNEETFVGDVITTVPEFVDRIYPVDDCSTDETWAEIRQAAEQMNTEMSTPENESISAIPDGGHSQLVVPIQHTQNRGVGGAIKTGYQRALQDDADIIAVMNGDGQMDPEKLDRLLDPIVEGKAVYAKGNRLQSSDHWTGMSRWRLFGNFLLTQLTRIASGYWRMKDPQNGYTAISATALDELDIDSLYEQYGFLNDLLIRLNANNMRIADVEMEAIYGDESSSIRYTQFVPRLSWLLLTKFLWRLKTKHADGHREAVLPYITGIIGGVIAVIFFLLHLVTVEAHSLATAGLAMAVSLVLLGAGMVIERRQNSVHQLTISE